MKKLLLPFACLAMLTSVSSCVKCYVCKDKNSNTFTKTEICDKDFDKGDVDARIEAAENLGATCHAKSRMF